MEVTKSSIKIFPARTKGRRAYGKSPLDLDLPHAIEAMNKIAQAGRSMSKSKLAIVLGNTVTSSAFARKIRALSSYGLIGEQPDGQFALTDLALAIALPRSPDGQMEAKKHAFLRIEQFAFLFNQHKGKLLPADEFLRNIIEQEFGIPRDTSDVWVRQFKSGAREAGLFHIRSDGKTSIAESTMFADGAPVSSSTPAPSPPPPDNPEETNNELEGEGVRWFEQRLQQPLVSERRSTSASGNYTRIDLSDGRRAEISIPDKLNAKDAEKLKRALQGIAVIIDSMVCDE